MAMNGFSHQQTAPQTGFPIQPGQVQSQMYNQLSPMIGQPQMMFQTPMPQMQVARQQFQQQSMVFMGQSGGISPTGSFGPNGSFGEYGSIGPNISFG
jgi:hypothetical protein